jgi:O-antigen/teichoic acid export membrane protein
MLRSAISVVLRVGGVGGKFVAVVALAADGGASEVGKFTLFFGAVNLLVFVVGLDFYQFIFRELIGRQSKDDRAQVLCGQLLFSLVIYSFLGLLAVYLSWSSVPVLGLPIGWLVLVLVSDHAAQEMSRIFTVLSLPNAANIVYAIKTGAWAWIGVGYALMSGTPLTADFFYPMWLVANLLALLYGGLVLRSELEGARPGLPPEFRVWLFRALRVGSVFYVASVSAITMGTIDRFVIAGNSSIADVGLFGVWHGVSSLIPVIVYAIAGMHFLPRLIRAYQSGSREEFLGFRRSFFLQSACISGIGAVVITALAQVLPDLLGKSDLASPPLLVVTLCLAAIATALWQVPYQVLYSSRNDVFLAIALSGSALMNVLLNLMLVPKFGIVAAASVAAFSNAALFIALSAKAGASLKQSADDPR